MVGQDLVELLSDVVLAQGVLQGEVELQYNHLMVIISYHNLLYTFC